VTAACTDLPTALPRWDLIARLVVSPGLWLVLLAGRTVYRARESAPSLYRRVIQTLIHRDERITYDGETSGTAGEGGEYSVAACGKLCLDVNKMNRRVMKSSTGLQDSSFSRRLLRRSAYSGI
jgi:hypothetical protein